MPDENLSIKALLRGNIWEKIYGVILIISLIILTAFLIGFWGMMFWANDKIMQMESYRYEHGHYPGEHDE